MRPGPRRLWIGVAIAVATLVLGRWAALFITGRLWEARISEAAAVVGTRFALLAAGLELLGLLIALAWFIGHLLWVTRAVLLQFGDVPESLSRVPQRTVYLVAVGLGVILGVAVGGGTGRWLGALLLNLAGVRFGVFDTLLQVDVGVFVAGLPLWDLLLERATALVLPALVAIVVVGVMGGAMRISERRLYVARPLRGQLALLLLLAAVLVAWSALTEPYRLAATRAASIGPSEFLLRTTVSRGVALFAFVAALLTFLWGLGFRFAVAVAGWVLLGVAILGGTILVQSRATGTETAADLAPLRRIDSLAFGAGVVQNAPPDTTPTIPSLWDRDVIARLLDTEAQDVVDAWPGLAPLRDRQARVWYLLRGPHEGDPALVAVADDQTGPTGGVSSLRWGDAAFSPGIVPVVTLSRHHARPGATDFDLSEDAAGVALWSAPRRIAVAWALQSGAALQAAPTQRIAWRLDPVERLEAVAPFADWTRPRVVVVDRDVYWVSVGFLAVVNFPASRLIPWRSRDVGYLRPAFIGVVRAQGAQTRIYLAPSADTLAAAWQAIAAPLIEPAATMPSALQAEIGVSAQEAAVVAQVLQGEAWLGRQAASHGRQQYPLDQRSAVGTVEDPHLMPFLDPAGQRVTALLRIPGPAGRPVLLEADSALALPSPRDLQQRWDRFPFFQQLRDSIRAAGAEFIPGLIRFGSIGDTLFAYQPSFAVNGGGGGGLVLVNVALGPRLGAGRTLAEAWQNLRGEAAPAPVGSDLGSRMDEARNWLDRADSALRRGDLLEFGRAFGYLRELLRPGRPLPPPAP